MRIIGSLIVMAMVFMYPDNTALAGREALLVFSNDIVPSLFPYMVLTRFLSESLGHKGNHSLLVAALLGMIGGSPSGTAAVSAMMKSKNNIKRNTLLAVCALSGTISPLFLYHTVGSWLSRPDMTIRLIISHFSAAILTSLIVFIVFRGDDSFVSNTEGRTLIQYGSVISSCVSSLLSIGGCLVFYSVLSSLVSILLPSLNGLLDATLHATLEIAGGLKKLSLHVPHSQRLTGILCAVSCGFSGISMLSQNYLFVKPLGVHMPDLMLMGILRAVMSGIVMFLLDTFA